MSLGSPRFREIDALFRRALEVPTEERYGWLGRLTEDPDLKAGVLRLLEADAAAEDFLAAPPVDDLVDPLPRRLPESWRRERMIRLLDLDRLLRRLASWDRCKAEIVRLRCFRGLTAPEIAESLGIPEATVRRDWRTARAWLAARLSSELDGGRALVAPGQTRGPEKPDRGGC